MQQVYNSLERHKGTACRIRFLPCSHSTLSQRDRGGMKFICLRDFSQVCTFHYRALSSFSAWALCVADRKLVSGLKLTCSHVLIQIFAHSYAVAKKKKRKLHDEQKNMSSPTVLHETQYITIQVDLMKSNPNNHISVLFSFLLLFFSIALLLLLLAYIKRAHYPRPFHFASCCSSQGVRPPGALWTHVYLFMLCCVFEVLLRFRASVRHVHLDSLAYVCVRNICEMQCCQIAFLLHCSLLRCLCNVITNHTWRASWHSHKVRMKYEDDYGDPRLYYHDFLIIASLIYFCLLSPFLSCSVIFFSPSSFSYGTCRSRTKR